MHWLNALLNVVAAAALLMAAACRVHPVARYYVKSLLLPLFIGINAIVSVPYGLLFFGQYRRNTLFSAAVSRLWDYCLGVEWEVEEERPVDASRGYVIVCNHQSSLDTYGMMRIWHKFGVIQTIVKKELMWTGPLALNLYLNGSIFVDRKSPKAHDVVNRAAAEAKRKGYNIWIYPEGTRNKKRDLTLLPFKKGAFHMALDAQMDILPVVIGQYDFLDPKRRRFESGRARIKILGPIPTAGHTKETMDDLIAETRDKMQTVLREISTEEAEEKKAL